MKTKNKVVNMIGTTLIGYSLFNLATPSYAENKKPLKEAGDYLRSIGIIPRLDVWNVSMYNINTGTKPHSFGNSGDIFIGADFDMERIAAIKGGVIHLDYSFFIFDTATGVPTENKWQGKVGSYMGGLPIHNDHNSGYLSQLAYEQKFLNDKLTTVVGRTNAQRYLF